MRSPHNKRGRAGPHPRSVCLPGLHSFCPFCPALGYLPSHPQGRGVSCS